MDLGSTITKAMLRSRPEINRAGYDSGLAYGKAFRRGVEFALRDITAKVKIDIDPVSVTRLRAIIRAASVLPGGSTGTGWPGGGGGGGGGASAAEIATLVRLLGGGGGGGGGGGSAGGPLDRLVASWGGRQLLQGQQLSGITSLIAGAPAPVQAGVAGVGVGAVALIAQTLAGGIVAGLGSGLAGLGIAGAFGAGGTEAAASTSARQSQLAAQDRVVAAQARLNTLRASGKATTQQLASAEASLASARGTLATATDKVFDVKKLGAQQQALRHQFSGLATSAVASLSTIGVSFIPVMRSILTNAKSTLDIMTPVFAHAVATISGPFKIFGDTIVKSLASPQVASSIQAVADAFGGILTAFAPDIPGIINSFADAIERIALAVSKNPKAFADFLNFVFQFGIALLNGIAYLTDFADWVEAHWTPIKWFVVPTLSAIIYTIQHFGKLRHEVAAIWDQMWNNTIGRAERGLHDLAVLFDGGRHDIAARVDQTSRDTNNIWNSFWNNTIGRAIRGVRDVVRIVGGIKQTLNAWHQVDSPSRHIWDFMWNNIVSITINRVRNVISLITNFVHGVVFLWRWLQIASRLVWNQIWDFTVGQSVRGYQRLLPVFRSIRNMVVNWWRAIASASQAVWNQIWSNTIGQAIRGVQSLTNVFSTIRGRVTAVLRGANTWLVGVGHSIIDGMLAGINQAMRGVGSWLNRYVVQPVIHAIKFFFGIKSPATVMLPVGANIVKGVIQGMLTSGTHLGGFISKIFGGWPQALGHLVTKSLVDVTKLPAKALNALGSVFGKIGGFFAKLVGGGGGGVSRWAGTVMQALALNHLPMSLLGQVLAQISTESGGNPNAINLTDINAQMGDPSRGLLQTIGSTFAAYHVAGTSGNIYDPLANIAAALNYAMHVYGPSLMRGGMGLGSGHGYDLGGYAPPGASWFWNGTGRPEPVLTDSQWNAIYSAARGGDGAGVHYHAHFDGLTGQAIEGHVQTAFRTMSITQGNLNRSGRRS